MLLGCHLSISDGLTTVIDEAERLDANAVQIFSHSPSQWRMSEINPDDADAFIDRRSSSTVRYAVVHTMYLINLGSPKEALYRRSTDALAEELRRAAQLGIGHVVTHLGAHTGSGMEAAVGRIIGAVNRVLEDVELPVGMHLLLENTAGAGTTVGSRFSELGQILDQIRVREHVGVCLDTCHAFAAGYDVGTPDGVDATVEAFDAEVGLQHLALIHLNDSKHPLGSRKDRHEHIGRGQIRRPGVERVVNHPDLRDLPFILETPKENDEGQDADVANLGAVRQLRHRQP